MALYCTIALSNLDMIVAFDPFNGKLQNLPVAFFVSKLTKKTKKMQFTKFGGGLNYNKV